MSIAQNLKLVKQHIPSHVKLVCVTKFHPDETIMEAYRVGERIFGESKVQELAGKYQRLPKDIQWHFIGHLQTNKVKYLLPFVDLIHGVDSLKLLSEINKQAAKINRKINCLLQVHIATEDTKFGFSEQELIDFFESGEVQSYKNISLKGLMGMATFTDNQEQVQCEFTGLKQLFDTIQKKYVSDYVDFKEISMGMSDDFQIAIEAGSTMVRIGSSIFGQRVY
ncbi:MAG: YggS family pyridoxal phosphate-dependent enzyme [Paludibacter sp.]|nr:YggS family pyridoxal phosphate-dependent enzyme [Paludibacter sp.]